MSAQPDPHPTAEVRDPGLDLTASYALDPAYVRALTEPVVSTTGESRPTYSPLNGQPLGVVPQSSADDVEQAFRRARRAQQVWSQTPVEDRERALLRLHDLVLDRQEEIGDLVCWESGKARKDAFDEILHVALTARYYGRTGRAHLGTERKAGVVPLLTRVEVNRIPKGVVGIISPWNYPFTLALCDGLPALLAGNAVVHKPDAQTMLTALLGVRLLEEAGFPRDLWQVVAGPGRVLGGEIIGRADYVCFTGSTPTGKVIAKQCADRLIGCSLELGGKNPILVLRDADLDKAAEGAVRASFSNSGQLCVSTERMFVADQVYDRFVERFVARVKAMNLAPGLGWGSDMGSLISQDQLDAVTAHVEDARAKGARVLAGGRPRPDLGPFYYEPTVLEGVTPDMACFGSETFGPVVSVYRFADEADAVARANEGQYGLNASIYSQDGSRARAIARQIKCGTVNINEAFGATFASIESPMGGMRESGLGRRQGSEGIHRYTETQSVATQRLIRLRSDAGHERPDLRQDHDREPAADAQARKEVAMSFDFDVLVVGSGFGGSVSALRLTEKGYRVGVLEAGARFEDKDFADTSFDVRRYLFRPEVGCYGIQRIDALRDCLILSGAGVGGGSLVYANTLYEPLPAFYDDPQWRDITDWRSELAPYYDQAKRMLGVVDNPLRTPSDDVMEKVANDMGVGETFHPTPVGVFFGGPEQPQGSSVEDPYFGGAGPDRHTCLGCGECMTGCRHNAKNTLVKNYLYLAERNGAVVLPLTTVTRVRPRDGGGYEVTVRYTKAKVGRRAVTRTLTAEQVVFSASALGTQRLLHRMRDEGHLPRISPRLGFLSRTNSESILGAIAPDTSVDYSQGVAITSSFHPDPDTHIEPVRYGKGSNVMSLMQTVLTDGDGPRPRWQTWLAEMWREKWNVLDLYDMKHWSERTVIALVMQTVDNSITTFSKRGRLSRRWHLSSRQGHGAPNPTWIPVANQAVRKMADLIGGRPGGSVGEPFNRPLTAHFIGGCTIGESPETGVVDPFQRLFNHPGLHVVDGSAITANLGVNPSLTITAQAERAMAFWPNKGEADPRPSLGAPYRRIDAVRPRRPAVPDSAPGALRLPIVSVS